ncbi:DUF2304 domain-containing protein [Cryobacterium zongtaii]|uniref:DUF2304 domain-containing protein n=1 Tax=Cryobacterium zongtaii TaxID=1259217 RepID=A0A2S3ZM08_9MICO|nr:DUF2304 domain-containing protein [Cryobacterium zongtaii]POH69714.1 DUF2304 domain-containing protein [Cryobacterium zongtaii]
MNVSSYLLGILAALLILIVVVEMLRRHQLRERHATWWLFAGVLALIVGIFPASLVGAAKLLGVELPVNLVFFVALIILFLVCLQQSSELTSLEAKTRTLVEQSALQDLRIRALEDAASKRALPPVDPDDSAR